MPGPRALWGVASAEQEQAKVSDRPDGHSLAGPTSQSPRAGRGCDLTRQYAAENAYYAAGVSHLRGTVPGVPGGAGAGSGAWRDQ